MQEIFKLDCFFIENYYKMCVAIIMADPIDISSLYTSTSVAETIDFIINIVKRKIRNDQSMRCFKTT